MRGEWCYASKKKLIGMIMDKITHCNSASSRGSRESNVNMETVHVYIHRLSVRLIKTTLINFDDEFCRFFFLVFSSCAVSAQSA